MFDRLDREWGKCLRKLSTIANKNLNEKGYRIYFEDIDYNKIDAGDGDEGYVILKATLRIYYLSASAIKGGMKNARIKRL